MPRPRIDRNGNIVPESELRNLWIIRRTAGIKDEWYPDGMAYLTRDGKWGPVDLAATWNYHEKALAEDVMAAVILTDPGRYFGKLEVMEILG